MGATGVILHASLLGLYIYVMYVLHGDKKTIPGSKKNEILEVAGKFSARFLTNWTFGLQAIYFALSLLARLLGAITLTNAKLKLNKLVDFLFLGVATPMAFVVSIAFWGLYSIDRELVYPKVLDLVIPIWVNHAIHTINSLSALVDLVLVNHKKPSWSSSIKGLTAYLLIYSVCLFGTYFQTGIWLYPFLKELSWPIRGAFAIGTLFLAFIMMAVLRGLHSLFWTEKSSASGAPAKKKTTSKQKKK